VWTGYTLFRLGFQLVFLVAPSVVVLWLTSVIARRFGRDTEAIATLTLALSFAVTYYGAASTYVTDPLAVALLMAALLAVIRTRPALAGVAIGAGAALKLFPILLIPAVIFLITRRAAVRLVTAAAGVVAITFTPGLVNNRDIFMSPFRWQSSRPPWETWYAFTNWLTDAPHEYLAPYFQDASAGSSFGWVFTGITPVASVLQVPVPAGLVRWEDVVSLIGSRAIFTMCLSARSSTPRAIVRWCLFVLAGFLSFAIGWSPQYELYLIPLILLAFENPFVGAGAATFLQVVTFLDYPVLLPWAYFYGGSAVWLEWAAVLARYLVLGWICLFVLRSEASYSAFATRVGSWLRPSMWQTRTPLTEGRP
jgi:hypothetical protein